MITGPRRLLVAVALALVPVAGPGLSRQTVTLATDTAARADGRPLLVIVEDAVAPASRSWVRAEERRADAVIVVRWLRSCDRLQVVSIPATWRSTPAASRSPSSSALGRAGVEDAVRSAFGLDHRHRDARPRRRRSARCARSRRAAPRRPTGTPTGFTGGPGPVVLDADDMVAFLRRGPGRSARRPVGSSPTTTPAASGASRPTSPWPWAARAASRRRGPSASAPPSAATATSWSTTTPIMGFLVARWGAGDVDLASVAVEDERPDRERRSPFLLGEVSAMHRSVLAPGGGDVLAARLCGPGTSPEAAAG